MSEHIDRDSPPPNSADCVTARVGKLDTISDIRNELARLYRTARKNLGNNIDPSSATKLAYLLNCIGRSLEGYELEKRIVELELKIKTRP